MTKVTEPWEALRSVRFQVQWKVTVADGSVARAREGALKNQSIRELKERKRLTEVCTLTLRKRHTSVA